MNVYIKAVDQMTIPAAAELTSKYTAFDITKISLEATLEPVLVSASLPLTKTSEKQLSSGWLIIVIRIPIPVLIAGVFIVIITYRMRKKTIKWQNALLKTCLPILAK